MKIYIWLGNFLLGVTLGPLCCIWWMSLKVAVAQVRNSVDLDNEAMQRLQPGDAQWGPEVGGPIPLPIHTHTPTSVHCCPSLVDFFSHESAGYYAAWLGPREGTSPCCRVETLGWDLRAGPLLPPFSQPISGVRH